MKLQPGQRAIVMGLAKSGEAAARLLHKHGVTVTVNEGKELLADDPVVRSLQSLGIRVISGSHPLALLDEAPDFIVKNPGIPYHVPLLEAAKQRGIPIYTEIEIASWITHSPIYAITGSNGKTTTTTLVGEVLREAGRQPVVAGNIGNVLSGVVTEVADQQPIVLEVSSFQLLGTAAFHPAIAVLLNLYPAHLDYHGSFEAYADAKWKLFANMQADDIAVLNYDQQHIRDRGQELSCKVCWFSTQQPVPAGVYVADGFVTERRQGVTDRLYPVSDIALPGQHNLENVLAATLVARSAGVQAEQIHKVVSRFQGVEHRLEPVGTVNGVQYVNDSKATNSEACLRALRSFPSGVVWIAGGLDRGDDFAALVDEVHQRVQAAVLLGESADALERACQKAQVPSIRKVSSLADAVATAAQLALPGGTVLLSPACASWDMFKSFEERGGMFKSLVHRL